jgi:hypothetical protein
MCISRSTTKLWIGVIAIGAASAAIVGALSIHFSTPPSPICPPEIGEMVTKAEMLQADRKWCEAKAKWVDVQKEISKSAPGACLSEAALAANNFELLSALCDESRVAPEKTVELRRVPPVPPVSGADLLLYYPQGRHVKTVGLFSIKGQGEGQNWGLKGKSHFRYVHEMEAEWTVEQNDKEQPKNGETVIFSVHLVRVEETMAMSQGEIGFAPIDDPTFLFAWEAIGQPLLQRIPVYRLVGDAVKPIGGVIAKKGLNWAASHLKNVQGIAQPEVLIAEQVVRLNGLKLRLKFENGFGITRIETLENPGGAPITKALLTSLAEDLNPLADYKVFPGYPVGKEWEVEARDLSGLSAVGGDATLEGKVKVKREPGEVGGNIAVLSIASGLLKLKGTGPDAEQQADVKVKMGALKFDIEQKLIVSGELAIHGMTKFQSKNHLVFKTSRLNDIEMKSRYEAKRVN